MHDRTCCRRGVLTGVAGAFTVAMAGCGSTGDESTETEIRDSDGDGVIDSQDYAPRDPDVQAESDLQSSGGTPSGEGGGDQSGSAGGSDDTAPADASYPSHSGTHRITARDNFWVWEFSVETEFTLEYRVTNLLDENRDFDVLLYTQSSFREYRAIANEVEDGARPEYLDGSAPGVTSGVEATGIRLSAGTYYLVVDNTDLSDAGDFGTEETRRVRVDAATTSV